MSNLIPSAVASLFVLAAALSASAATEPILVLRGLDAVSLAEGKEEAGREEFALTKGRFRYQFASAGNRRRFEAAPNRHGIRFDGYCMKMGPLSGRGSVERWFVHEGRIYVFASEGCRDSFKADPAAFIDVADAPPAGGEADRQRGRELLERAAAGFGGAAVVDALRNVQIETTLHYEQGGKKFEFPRVQTIGAPGQVRVETRWGENATYGHVLTPRSAVEIEPKGSQPMAADVREFVTRALYRNPLAIVRSRREAGLVAVAAGRGEVAGVAVEWVKVGFKGATTTLGVEPRTGRVLQVSWRGRAPSTLGEVQMTFDDFRALDDRLEMPFGIELAHNGKPASQPKTVTTAVHLDVLLAADFFTKGD